MSSSSSSSGGLCDCLKKEKPTSPSPLITIAIGSLGGFVFGYDTGIMAVATEYVQNEYQIPSDDNVTKGFITSVVLFGAMIGSLLGGILAAKLGRKLTGFIAAGICLFGGVTSAFSPFLWTFMLLRLILGVGVGLVGVICPMYVSETAPKRYKGMYGVLFQLSLTFGILVSYVVGYGFTHLSNPSIAWRLMLGTGGALSGLLLLIVIFFGMVETAVPNNRKGALNDEESRPLARDMEDPTKRNTSVISLLYKGRRGQTLTGIILAGTLQLTGINAIMYYGPIIIKSAGFDQAVLLNIGIGVWNFLTTFIAAALVERLGRKYLIVGGTAVMSVALVVVGLFLNEHIVHDPTTKGIGVGVGLLFFIGGFEGGIGCLFWVLANEIFDEDVREAGAAMANILQWGFNLVVSSAFPIMFSALGNDVTFYIFGGIGVACTIYLACFIQKEKDASQKF